MWETAEALDDVAMLLRIVQIVRVAHRLQQLDQRACMARSSLCWKGMYMKTRCSSPSDLSRPKSTAARAIARAAG